MRYLIPLSCLLVAAFAASSPAKTLNATDAQGFQAIAFVSDSNDFIGAWHHTPRDEPPYIKAVREVRPGEKLTGGFLASGMKTGPGGGYLVVFDVRITNPDGQVVVEQLNYARASGMLEGGDAFVLADPALSFEFRDTDPKGQYMLEVTAKDQMQGTSAAASYPFVLQ